MSRSVIAAVALHYGKDYFKASLESIRNQVDEIAVFYTPNPSYGANGGLRCPDSREELRSISEQFNCVWTEINKVGQENKHRQQYLDYALQKGFEQVLVVDSDEVHISDEIPQLLESAWNTNVRRVGVNGDRWVTLWRSFNEYVQDGFAPVRVINLSKPEGQQNVSEGFIYHMGYAIRDELMEYKISCHGHAADFRRNNTWLRDKWHGYKRGETKYLHPATDAYWIETKDFDKTNLPECLKEHEYYNLDRIK